VTGDPRGFSLAAVGDVALLHRPATSLFRSGWDEADIRIANLEAPLTTGGVPAVKLIRLQSPPEAATWLKEEVGCDVVSLANNHIMDWGVPGLESTLSALDQAGIHYAGAGLTDRQAAAPRIVGVNGWTIAFLSWACTVPPGFRSNALAPGLAAVRVRTSYAADPYLIDEQPGTPPWVHTEAWSEDVAALEDALAAARVAADFVVLAVHWGVPPQWQSAFQGPLAEYQEALAPRLMAAGADLVLGHHAHTVYGLESSGSRLVCFSLGNYIFHPLAAPRPLPLDAPSRPYTARGIWRMRAAVIRQHGASDTLRIEDVPTPTPCAGEVLIKVGAVGLNHLDVFARQGLSGPGVPQIKLPHVSGVRKRVSACSSIRPSAAAPAVSAAAAS
jgi:poly-gamma-glutamate synthesis protein (capsule biosynthesis protein)